MINMGIRAVITYFFFMLMQIVVSIKSGLLEIYNILKRNKQKIALGFLRFVSILLQCLKKDISEKILLEVVNILF